MAAAIGRWSMMKSGIFLLVLQLVGINLSATAVFRLCGLTTHGARYDRGKHWVFPASLSVTVVAIAALLTWQFATTPNLQRSSRTQRATAAIQQTVSQSQLVKLVEADVEFTRANIDGQNTLLCLVYVQRQAGVTASDEEIRQQLSRRIQNRLQGQEFDVTPLVNVTIFDTPTLNP
jgi:uncharacterized membrane protein